MDMKDVVIQRQQYQGSSRPSSAGPGPPSYGVKRMSVDEERIKIRMALRALDERDLDSNIISWLKHVAVQGTERETPRLLLLELFQGLDASNVNGRKQRFRLARHLVNTSAWVEFHDTVPAILKTMLKRASEEKSQGLYEEEAKFLQDLTDCALRLAAVQDEGRRDWVGQSLAKPFLDVVSKTLNAQKIAGCSRHLQAILSACAMSTHIDLDVSQAIARDVSRRVGKVLHHHRQHCAKIPEVYALMEKCCEITQLELSHQQVQTLIELFSSSLDNKDNWHVRKAGLELLTTVSTVFVDAPKYPGDSEAREVLRKYMGVIQGCLDKARYDKIVHVRKAMQKAQAAFNAVELVSFDDYAVELEDLSQKQAGAPPSRSNRAAHSRRPFRRPQAKLGNDFGIQIFVPLEDESEQNEIDLVRRAPLGDGRQQQGLNKDASVSATSSPEASPQGRRVEEAGEGSREAAGVPEGLMEGKGFPGGLESTAKPFQDSLMVEGQGKEGKDRMMSVSNHTLESLLTIHAQEIEKFYREKEKEELEKLKEKFEKHFKKLQEAFERDTTKVKSVIQSAIDKEIDFFKEDRLPKLAKLLSEKRDSAPAQ
ncbi:hypothetical protein HOP50_10g58620 [Chloropicon primus]|uniref:Uncharacterized protein n=1 Tax=Chloropicon primus TaxID=1764295 RepID=A0A5B8MU96_9CHLO|nr:hypothetical protein A3770_10p58420 [Chloropicon primus]UPR02536.1 hypothetical protein HOP50_10g58620 [Chloropicon primus]|mmetsp:Transcript_9530/g.27095  ORF Transcript_9530/g.27095 Transcript_9530/m.27095 type:complete len:595 (-) Transcript_9530:1898-3682(-)|eukprot:QDZ23324.1 hypothetical protein A3770_10p58420 [Chloropicon primus]